MIEVIVQNWKVFFNHTWTDIIINALKKGKWDEIIFWFLSMNRETAVSMISKNEIVNICFNSFQALHYGMHSWGCVFLWQFSVIWNQVFRYVNLLFDIDNEILSVLFKLLATHCFVNWDTRSPTNLTEPF